MRVNFNLLALAGGAAIIGPFWPVHPLLESPGAPATTPPDERRASLRAQQTYTLREAERLVRCHVPPGDGSHAHKVKLWKKSSS